MNNLNEDSLSELLDQLKKPISLKPRELLVTPDGYAWAKARARQEPDFAARVKQELGIDLLVEDDDADRC